MRLAIGIVLAVTAGVGAVSCGAPRTSDTVQVKALWYGQASNGAIQSGLTPVVITAGPDDPKTPFSVDTGGLRAAGAGAAWIASAEVAGVQAVLIAGVDPRRQQLKYSMKEAIDGPSAGALLSVGSLAAIRSAKISRSTTMTGTVLPDGSIGPVSGEAEKIRAAAAAGFTRVLVPPGPVFDLRTGARVDLAAVGRSVGVTVTPVNSVPDAYAQLAVGSPTSFNSAGGPTRPKPEPDDTRLLHMLTRRSQGLIDATVTQMREASSGGEAPSTTAPLDVTAWLSTAENALKQGDPVKAFAAAAEAAQAQRQAAASAHLFAAPKGASLTERAEQVKVESRRAMSVIRAEVRSTAERPVTKLEQLAALPDVLAWGVYALTAITVGQKLLKTVRSAAQLDEIVRFLATAEFEAETYMPATAESLAFIGTRRISDVERTVGLLKAYAELFTYAGQANRRYADSLRLSASKDSYLEQLIEESSETRGVATEFQGLRGPTARAALQMALALVQYVETAQLVNLANGNLQPTVGPPNLAPIRDAEAVRNEALSAQKIADTQAGLIAAAGLDPTYLEWNNKWGADLALGRLPDTTSEQMLHGLEYQWFAVLQSRLVIALSGTEQHSAHQSTTNTSGAASR
jgi:Lon protease (S16) C-terminal proteolytic domain